MDLAGVPFTKVYRSMLTSSIWTTPHPQLHMVRCVWVTLMLLADRHGYVHASVPGLAAAALVTLEEAEQALEIFRSPDPYSRTREYDGRRLVDVDGGWLLLNYEKHRDSAREEVRRATKRDWYHRQKNKRTDTDPSPPPPPPSFPPSEVPVLDGHCLARSSLDTLDRQRSVSVFDLRSDLSLAGPDQVDPGPSAQAHAPEPPPETTRSATLTELPEEWTPSPELRAAATLAGVRDLDKHILSLREGPIGGRRGVLAHKLAAYVERQFPRWRTWEETEAKAKANCGAGFSSGSTNGARGYPGRGGAFAPVLEPKSKHVRFARHYGIDLAALVREVNESEVVRHLGTDAFHEYLEKYLAREAKKRVDQGAVPPPKSSRPGAP